MADEDQIQLELEPQEDEIEIVDAPEEPKIEEKPQLTVEIGIDALKTQLEEEKRARELAERRVKEAMERETVAKNDAADSNMRMIDNAIETLKRNQEILKQNLRDAVASGDADAQAEILMGLNKTEIDLRDVQRGKQQYQANVKRAAVDPVEALASQLTPKSAEWIRAHPEAVQDPVLNRKLRRAHEDAVDDGIIVDSPEYFSFVENRLRFNRQEAPQMQESALSEASSSTAGRRAAAPPAAPVSRSGTGTGTRPSNVVRLSAAEREAARDMGMTEKEYAINKMALIKENKLVG